MSHETGSTTIEKLEPKNIGEAAGILSLCALELEIWLGYFSPPPVAGKRRKKPLPGEGLNADSSRTVKATDFEFDVHVCRDSPDMIP